MPLADHLAKVLQLELSGKRVAPDVSVLLAGMLDKDSPSQRTFAVSAKSTIVLSDHVEDLARRVLAYKAPHLTGSFNDGLLRLSLDTRIERVAAEEGLELPEWTATLRGEDRKVLLGAMRGSADYLFTHDHAFFKGVIPRLIVQSPASFTWDPLEGVNVRPGQRSFTFLGWFYPQWSSEAVLGSGLLFFLFEIAGFMQCFYQANTQEYQLRWRTPSGATGGLRLPLPVIASSYNFVAVACADERVTFIVNGVSRSANARLGALPASTTFHPFQSAGSEHQVSGGCQFRVANTAYREAKLRRHFVSRSVQLTDTEIDFADWATRSALLVVPATGIIVPP